jgi:hypothetical protein
MGQLYDECLQNWLPAILLAMLTASLDEFIQRLDRLGFVRDILFQAERHERLVSINQIPLLATRSF